MGICMQMSLKAPCRSYKSTDDRDWPICCSLLDAESTGFGPKRLRRSVPPLSCLFPSNMVEQRSRAPAYTSQLVAVPAVTYYILVACLTFFGCSPVTRVELDLSQVTWKVPRSGSMEKELTKLNMARSHHWSSSSCGGMGPEADIVVKRIADALASKRKESYSKVVWLDALLLGFLSC